MRLFKIAALLPLFLTTNCSCSVLNRKTPIEVFESLPFTEHYGFVLQDSLETIWFKDANEEYIINQIFKSHYSYRYDSCNILCSVFRNNCMYNAIRLIYQRYTPDINKIVFTKFNYDSKDFDEIYSVSVKEMLEQCDVTNIDDYNPFNITVNEGYGNLENIDFIVNTNISDDDKTTKHIEYIYDIKDYNLLYSGNCINPDYNPEEERIKRTGISFNNYDIPKIIYSDKTIVLTTEYLCQNSDYFKYLLDNVYQESKYYLDWVGDRVFLYLTGKSGLVGGNTYSSIFEIDILKCYANYLGYITPGKTALGVLSINL